MVNDALAHDFYWGRCSSNKIFISQCLFHQEKINYPNPEELDEERMKEHDLNPDEFNEPMYDDLYLWIYCDSQEKVEIETFLIITYTRKIYTSLIYILVLKMDFKNTGTTF